MLFWFFGGLFYSSCLNLVFIVTTWCILAFYVLVIEEIGISRILLFLSCLAYF